MYIRAHHVVERIKNHSVSLQRTLTSKLVRHYMHRIVPFTLTGASVTFVEVAFVPYLELDGLEGGFEQRANSFDTANGIHFSSRECGYREENANPVRERESGDATLFGAFPLFLRIQFRGDPCGLDQDDRQRNSKHSEQLEIDPGCLIEVVNDIEVSGT